MNAWLTFCLFFALATAPGAAQTSEPTATSKEPPKATLQGAVLNAVTSEPIRSAFVLLTPESVKGTLVARSISSGRDGRFTIPDVEPGRYRLLARKAGFIEQEHGAKRPGQRRGVPIEVSAGATLRDLDIKLAPQAVISGRVLDESDEPVVQAPVRVLARTYDSSGKPIWLPQGSDWTDDRGVLRIYGISPGTKILLADPPQLHLGIPAVAVDPKQLAFAATYYPNADTPETAARLRVTAQTELQGIDVRLQRRPSLEISGSVVMPPECKRAYVAPMIESMNSFQGLAGVAPDEKGKFRLPGLSAGTYVISATCQPGADGQSAWTRLVLAESSVENLLLTITPGLVVTGSVRYSGESKAGKSSGPAHYPSVILQATASAFGGGSGALEEDGSFRVKNVRPGKFLVTTQLPYPDAYLKSVRYASRNVSLQDPIEILDPPARLEVEVGFSSTRAFVTVIDEDGKPSPSTTVFVYPVDPALRGHPSYVRFGQSGSDGRFEVLYLPEGEYFAVAMDELPWGQTRDPEFLKRIEPLSQRIPLRGNDSPPVRLTIQINPDPAG